MQRVLIQVILVVFIGRVVVAGGYGRRSLEYFVFKTARIWRELEGDVR